MTKSSGKKRPDPSRPRGPQKGDEAEPLADLLARLGITEWDFLLVGDGAGSGWDGPCGWGAVLVERESGKRTVWDGTLNSGTVNFAEIMAYLQPLTWLASREDEKRKRQSEGRRAHHIHIVTDSQYCAQVGNGPNRVLAKNTLLWGVFSLLARQGFLLHWHWLERDNCALNRYADRLSKLARGRVRRYNDLQRRLEAEGAMVGAVNPSTG
jgi:ribonuclease HI